MQNKGIWHGARLYVGAVFNHDVDAHSLSVTLNGVDTDTGDAVSADIDLSSALRHDDGAGDAVFSRNSCPSVFPMHGCVFLIKHGDRVVFVDVRRRCVASVVHSRSGNLTDVLVTPSAVVIGNGGIIRMHRRCNEMPKKYHIIASKCQKNATRDKQFLELCRMVESMNCQNVQKTK